MRGSLGSQTASRARKPTDAAIEAVATLPRLPVLPNPPILPMPPASRPAASALLPSKPAIWHWRAAGGATPCRPRH